MNDQLTTALQAAVPLEIPRVASLTPEQRRELIDVAVETVPHHADDLLYGGTNCGTTFTALARGLAVLAHQPGGVTALGGHWCVNHAACLAGETTAGLDIAPGDTSTIAGLDRHQQNGDRCTHCAGTWPCAVARALGKAA